MEIWNIEKLIGLWDRRQGVEKIGTLAENIKHAVREERWVIGVHANRRLRERGIMAWQVISGLEEARLLLEREDGVPDPVAEFEQQLPDGTPVKVAWAWISKDATAKLVTVFFFPRMGTWR